MKKFWNWIKVALGIVFSVLVYTFFTRRNNVELKKKIDEVKKTAKIEEEKVKKIEKKIKNRKKEAASLAERLKKHFNIIIIICLMFCLSVGGRATNTIENLKTPETYQELVVQYKDMASVAIGYQRLYNEAEVDNQALIESIKNLQLLLKTQQDIIDELLKKNRFSVLTGVSYIPMHPSYSGIIAGVTFEF